MNRRSDRTLLVLALVLGVGTLVCFALMIYYSPAQ
jgi:hypothetical protein